MAEVRTEIDLFDSWYRIADVNKDGKVGGGEAVPFLQRSGLSKDALFKVSGHSCCCLLLLLLTMLTQTLRSEGDLRARHAVFANCNVSANRCMVPNAVCSVQIWSVVAGESAFLTKQQFYSAMRLISVAQARTALPDNCHRGFTLSTMRTKWGLADAIGSLAK